MHAWLSGVRTLCVAASLLSRCSASRLSRNLASEVGEGNGTGENIPFHMMSSCAVAMDDYERHDAACVLIQRNESGSPAKALMVYVTYGVGAPGWDLPGGHRDWNDIAGCQSAERETCEESGYGAMAVRRLSRTTFRCEVLRANQCMTKKAEGFLKQKWHTAEEIEGLEMRKYTWGNKRKILVDCLRLPIESGCFESREDVETPRHSAYMDMSSTAQQAYEVTQYVNDIAKAGISGNPYKVYGAVVTGGRR